MYTFFYDDEEIVLINTSTGNRVTVKNDDDRYTQFKQHILASEFELAEKMDVKSVVSNFVSAPTGDFAISVTNGVGVVAVNGKEYPLADAIVAKILKMDKEGFGSEPLKKFLQKVYKNPSKTAVDELFLFLEQTDLPINNHGNFIAYKVVRNDYKDHHTGTMDNSVGKVVEMPRFEVDDNRNRTCSSGLHFCSKGYLSSFGDHDSRCVLVEIDPSDVVSIPSDYNNAKGRTCKYVVISEVEGDWRNDLRSKDYNDTSVVEETAFNDADWDEVDGDDSGYDHLTGEHIDDVRDNLVDDTATTQSKYGVFWNDATYRWHDSHGKMVSKFYAAGAIGCNVEDLDEYK